MNSYFAWVGDIYKPLHSFHMQAKHQLQGLWLASGELMLCKGHLFPPADQQDSSPSTSTTQHRPQPSTVHNWSPQLDLHGSAAVSSSAGIDMELQPFDSPLQQRTSTHAISSSLAVLPIELKEVITGCLLDMNQLDVVVSIILEDCKKDVWKNGELSRLVEEYFGNRPETLHNCTMTLERFLNEVHLMALRCFEEDVESEKGDGKYACRTTLEELRNLIKAAGDPIAEELQSVYWQEFSVLEKMECHKQKVNKKLKSIKTWRKVSTIAFASAFAAILIGSVVAAAMAAPPVAAALAAAASVPVPLMGKWFDSLWKKYEDALKGEKELISAMIRGTPIIAIMELIKSIRRHVVEQLEIIPIDAILAAADSALGDEEAVKIDIGEIKKKLGDFVKSIKDLGEQVDMCTGKFTKARTDLLQKIIKYPVKK